MSVEAAAVTDSRNEAGYVAQVLADWWTRPDVARVTLWCSPAYREQVSALWERALGISPDLVTAMLINVAREQNLLSAEYERLFVGPAAIPCPPYEAVWRTDRPKHEQGTVMGKSTLKVKQLYGELGIRLRPDQAELADHIAIEFEALAFAWAIGDQQRAGQLLQGLREWLPQFCSSVTDGSLVQFYKDLAAVTCKAILSTALGVAD